MSSFWDTLAPRLAHSDDAVKHAVIALGATHYLFRFSEEGSRSVVNRCYRSGYHGHIHQLEAFIIRNYNMAIRKLQGHISSQQPDAVILVLVCCLVFVCLENLRFDSGAAIAHLKTGANIIVKSFDLRRLFRPSSIMLSSNKPISSLISDNELTDIVYCFRHLEISERLFAFDVPLTITSHFYDSSRLDDDKCVQEEFASLDQLHQAALNLVDDVLGYDWETSKYRGNPTFWSSPRVAKRNNCLSERGLAIFEMAKVFMASAKAPAPGTREYASCYQDIVQTLTMRGMTEMLGTQVSAQHHISERLAEVVDYTEKLLLERRAFTTGLMSSLDFTVEPGVVAPLYYACVYTTDPELKARALRLMSGCSAREGPWDGRSLVKLIQMCDSKDERMQRSLVGNATLPRWGGDMDCYRLFSALDITEW